MLSRIAIAAAFAFATLVTAKTQNADPQYAIMTVANEYELVLLEGLVKAGPPSNLLEKLQPVKEQIHKELASGKADLRVIAKQLGDFLLAADAASPGFQAAALELVQKNPVNFYGISKVTPEASWDFVYAAAKKAAAEIKNDKIAKKLEDLNDELEKTFQGSTNIDAAAVVAKVDQFTTAADVLLPGYSDLLMSVGDVEIDKYRSTLLKLQKAAQGEAMPDEAPTAADSSSGVASNATETVTAEPTAKSSSSGSNEVDSPAGVSDSPVPATTTTTTPAPTKSSAGSLLPTSLMGVVAAVVVAMALTRTESTKCAMPIITFVARVSDGMLLVASMESIGDASGNLDTYKQQGKQIMKRLDQRSPTKCSIESGPYTFHYLIQEGVCYLTLSDRSFPKRLAFVYLDEIHAGFVEELERDYGGNWRDIVTTVARPYAFIKFDKFIQKKRKEYTDPNSSQNMHRLNDDLADIHNIMRKNIQEVLNRGERVEHVSRMSSNIAGRSKELKWGAKKLRLQAIYRQYAPIAAVALFVLLVIYIKFF